MFGKHRELGIWRVTHQNLGAKIARRPYNVCLCHYNHVIMNSLSALLGQHNGFNVSCTGVS